MQEFWVCEACGSITPAQNERCYRCRAARRETAAVLDDAVHDGPQFTPGLDDDAFADVWRLRETYPYAPAGGLGRLCVALLAAATLSLGALACLVLASVASSIASRGLFALDPATGTGLVVAGAVALVVGVAALAVHTAYLDRLDRNAPALGGGELDSSTFGARLFWPFAVLNALLAYAWFVLWIPAAILLEIILHLGLAPFVDSRRISPTAVIGSPLTCLLRPARVLRELRGHLAVPGQGDERPVAYWTGAWLVFGGTPLVGIAVCFTSIVLAGAAFLAGFALTGREIPEIGNGSVGDFAVAMLTLATAVETLALAVLAAASTWYTAAIRQSVRVREAWIEASAGRAGRDSRAPGVAPASRW